MKVQKIIYTIGHSNHPIDYFNELLETYAINCVVDVRSTPASSYNPQYNKQALSAYLKRNHILYLHFGEEFGARRTETDVLDVDGKVDFDKVRKSEKFLSGIERLKTGLEKGFRIALMCSEADPFDCHRFSLISYYLVRHGFSVCHILKDKTCIDNSELEKLLLKKYRKKLPENNLFCMDVSETDRLDAAYRLRGETIAYDTLNL